MENLRPTEFSNELYQSEMMKKKIQSHPSCKNKVGFVKLNESSKYQSYIVYNINTDLSEVIKLAYGFGNNENAEYVALKLKDEGKKFS